MSIKFFKGISVMNSNMKLLMPFAAQTGLSADARGGILFGVYGGYNITVSPISGGKTMQISVGVKVNGQPIDNNQLQLFAKQNKSVFGICRANGYRVDFNVKQFLTAKSTINKGLRPGIEIVAAFLRSLGAENCCQACGKSEDLGTYYTYNCASVLCDGCYSETSADTVNRIRENEAKAENPIGGFVGALLGSLLGAAAIILISQLGYVAAISGVIMGVCTLKGDEMLGGKISKTGVIISCAVMVVMVFLSYQLDSAILLSKEYTDYSVFECFKIYNNAVFTGGIIWENYLPSLIMLYAFTALGAVPTVKNRISKQYALNTLYRMDGQSAPVTETTEI